MNPNKKPFDALLCGRLSRTPGLEEAVKTMGRGGIRKVSVPADLGFGAVGATFPDGTIVPPNAALEFVVNLEDVSPSYL